RFIPLDLGDRAACFAVRRDQADIMHVVSPAVLYNADLTRSCAEADQVPTNLAMLRNLVEAVERASPKLRHITLLQGTKAYGVHLGPFKVPAKETSPRYMPPNFYYEQEDWLRTRQAGKAWNWTILRPQIVCGFAVG